MTGEGVHVLGRRFILRPKRICVWIGLSRMAFSLKFWYVIALRVVGLPSFSFFGSVGCGVLVSGWVWLMGLFSVGFRGF